MKLKKELKTLGANFEILEYDKLIDKTADFLSNGKAVGVVSG